MKHLSATLPLMVIIISSCQSSVEKADTISNASTQKKAKGGLQRLAGTWVGQRKDGFDLVKIAPDSTGTYTHFTDRKQWGGITPDDTMRYFLYESPIRVKYEPNSPYQTKVAIHTSRFRFDYELVADTLIEIDKMGVQGKLVRIRPEK
jgi:hypothetical protein